jgi:2,3-bisphosphoglycerate-dependent phosphoglycerate mutase
MLDDEQHLVVLAATRMLRRKHLVEIEIGFVPHVGRGDVAIVRRLGLRLTPTFGFGRHFLLYNNRMSATAQRRPGKLVMIRHGQSDWNLKNLFTGWTDVDLTEQGIIEARAAARTLMAEKLTFDIAFTSVLTRAIRTLWIILDEMKLMWIPIELSWRLNERHYGDLQGLDKAATAAKHGAAQVKIWRRSYDVPPPPLEPDDPRHPRHDARYAGVPASALPATESLKSTLARVKPYWEERIVPELKSGKNVLIAAHGNSLRALVKMLEGVSDADITELNIPTGAPRIYEFDTAFKPVRAEYLGDAAAIAAAANAVANQAGAQ